MNADNRASPLVSVAFATFNGGPRLKRTLDALVKTDLDQDDWKLIAVDNGSTDQSREILEAFSDRLPMMILHQSKPGKGFALDLAFRHLEGPLTVLIDDDVLPNPEWLRRYVEVSNYEVDYDIFGGQILPEWEAEPPEWILRNIDLAPVFAINASLSDGEISPHRVFGPNCAFRTHILPSSYSVQGKTVGPDYEKPNYAMGGDTALSLYLASKGHRSYHTTKAKVRHIIPKSHMTEEWVMGRSNRFGRGFVHAHPESIEARKLLLRTQLAVLRLSILALAKLPFGDLRTRLLWKVNWQMGVVGEIMNLRSTEATLK